MKFKTSKEGDNSLVERKTKRENIPLKEMKQMGGKNVEMVQLFSVMYMPPQVMTHLNLRLAQL